MALDADGDGDISIDEMEILLQNMRVRLQLSGRDIQRILKEFDENGDGTVDIKEFLSAMTSTGKRGIIHKALIQRAGIRKAFSKYDKDGNGVITRDEFRRVVEAKYQAKFTSKSIDKLMHNADTNNDGRIDFEEFAKAFTYIPVSK